MNLIQILFWTGLVIVVYAYVGYGIIIWLLARLRPANKTALSANAPWPETTLVIAAYNEEDFIREKIDNTLKLHYPKEKLNIFIVTDGSTDRTQEIVREFPGIRLFHEDSRRGKIHAVNRIMPFVKTETVIFCDANTFLNKDAIQNIVRHYADPQVGGVAGEKRIMKQDAEGAPAAGEGLYWKYESFLKRKDSEVYSVMGAAGELFSVRTALFEAPDENMVIEDFYMSMRVVARGYRFIYEPEAYAEETASATVADEWKRKVRISAGAFQAMGRLMYLLNPFRYGVVTFMYFSHRVLRWTLAPIALPIVLITAALLAPYGLVYLLAFLGQVAFYGLALLGHLLRKKSITIKGFFVPYYFTVMNLSVFAGFVRHLRGRQSVVWEKAARAKKQSASA